MRRDLQAFGTDELVVFEGTLGASMGTPRRVRVAVRRGSEAHVFAMSRGWLHEVMTPAKESTCT